MGNSCNAKNNCDAGTGNALKDFWNKRFADEGYVYGTKPNVFFKSIIDNLPPGRILVPGAGEGRDAVYAASKGWDVYCIDVSDAGRNKAMRLAAERNVNIHYTIADISNASFPPAYFDVVASIFFHLPGDTRREFYRNMLQWLKPGGRFVMQAFTPAQLKYTSGGPTDEDLLVSASKSAGEVTGLELTELKESEIFLNEGTHHHGMASVLNVVGVKK